MDSDEVNSIHDTVESNQVARVVRGVFYDCASDLGLEVNEGLFELNPSGNPSQPTIMYLPSHVSKLYWIKYNNKGATDTHSKYIDVERVDYLDFYETQFNLDSSLDYVSEIVYSVNGEPFEFKYETNGFPRRFTNLTTSTLLFDRYDIDIDSTLVKNKTMCGGMLYPEFQMTDNFVIPVDPAQLSYLVNKAKVRCFSEIKQVENREAASEASRQKIAHQRTKNRLPDADTALQRQNKITGYGR